MIGPFLFPLVSRNHMSSLCKKAPSIMKTFLSASVRTHWRCLFHTMTQVSLETRMRQSSLPHKSYRHNNRICEKLISHIKLKSHSVCEKSRCHAANTHRMPRKTYANDEAKQKQVGAYKSSREINSSLQK